MLPVERVNDNIFLPKYNILVDYYWKLLGRNSTGILPEWEIYCLNSRPDEVRSSYKPELPMKIGGSGL
jgi:hypothetical protein